MTLCDTNVLIDAFNGRQSTIKKLEDIGLNNIVLSIITVMELYQGISNKTELAQVKRKIKYYDVIDIDESISKLAFKFFEGFHLSHNLQIPDTFIGATAIIHQIPLFTYNIKDFRFMPGFELIL